MHYYTQTFILLIQIGVVFALTTLPLSLLTPTHWSIFVASPPAFAPSSCSFHSTHDLSRHHLSLVLAIRLYPLSLPLSIQHSQAHRGFDRLSTFSSPLPLFPRASPSRTQLHLYLLWPTFLSRIRSLESISTFLLSSSASLTRAQTTTTTHTQTHAKPLSPPPPLTLFLFALKKKKLPATPHDKFCPLSFSLEQRHLPISAHFHAFQSTYPKLTLIRHTLPPLSHAVSFCLFIPLTLTHSTIYFSAKACARCRSCLDSCRQCFLFDDYEFLWSKSDEKPPLEDLSAPQRQQQGQASGE